MNAVRHHRADIFGPPRAVRHLIVGRPGVSGARLVEKAANGQPDRAFNMIPRIELFAHLPGDRAISALDGADIVKRRREPLGGKIMGLGQLFLNLLNHAFFRK